MARRCRRRPGPPSSPRSRGPPRTRPITPLLTACRRAGSRRSVLDELTAAGFVAVLAPKIGAIHASRHRPRRDLRFRRARPHDETAAPADRRSAVRSGEVRQPRLRTPASSCPSSAEVLRKAGLDDFQRLDMTLERYVSNFRWPGWVARTARRSPGRSDPQDDPGGRGPLPLVELPDRMPGSNPDKVRPAVDKLIAHLVLFEDLDPKTSDIMVGFLPTVSDGLILRRPAPRTPAAGGLRTSRGDGARREPDRQ